MLYFKNSDLAYTYHVSVRTVRNWIESAKQGKLDLTLHTHGQRMYVSNTARNIATIERLVEEGKKYRPHRAVKTVTPKPEFYTLYNEAQVYDIVSNLEIHHEIPREYNYFDGGANHWDKYVQRFATEETPNNLTAALRLLEQNRFYLDDLLGRYDQVNVVDIGVGNAYPVKELLAHLLEQEKLGRYLAIDISPDILRLAGANIQKWFDDRIRFEDYELDISHERFSNILAEEYIKPNAQKTGNLILFLGGTIQNFRQPDAAWRVIHDSMGVNDILIHTQKLDTESSRRYFDFNVDPGQTVLAPIHRVVVDMLNIDQSLYDIEMGYDAIKKVRLERIRLRMALNLRFEFAGGKRTIEFEKGDTILLWRAWQDSALDVINQLDRSDFYPLQVSQTEDHEYILTVSQIKRD